jgi:hypothetical protein
MGNDLIEAFGHALRHTSLSDKNVEAFARIAQRLVDKGLKPKRCFPRGIPHPDGAWLEYEVPVAAVPELVNLMAVEERLEEIRVHSIGVPANDGLRVRIGLR